MNTMTPAQKKIIIVSVAAVMIVALLGLFVYLPAVRKISLLKSELSGIEGQIEQIESNVGQGHSIAEGIEALNNKYRALVAKFPVKEEEALGLLSEFAKKCNITVVAIKSQPRVEFLDVKDQKVEVEGKVGQILPVSIEVKSNYTDLGKYLEMLGESLPAYVTVEELKIYKESGGSPDLKVTMELNLYLLA